MKANEVKLAQLDRLPSRAGRMHYVPMGGVGEIGMNCSLFEYDGEMVLVDCGQKMPDEEMLGIDYVIPDLEYVYANKERLLAIVITHAHEDHVGALPYVLPRLEGVPVYASDFTAALLKEKMREHGLKPNFQPLRPREQVKLSESIQVEPIAVTHSMIDAMAIALRTPLGVVIHSGDFKIDPSPPDGVAFDHYSFARFAEEEDGGVLLLLSDSTNVSRAGACPSETEVTPGLEAIFRGAGENALIISTFSSSMHRLQTVLNLAGKYGREVVACGLNMERNIRVASRLGALDLPPSYHDDPRAARRIPREKLLILCTGSQGEPQSSLARMAVGNHRDIQVQDGDIVVLSARMIPGNEGGIYRMINHLARRGARVIHEKMAPIHVSGHGYRDDMRHLLNLTNPRYFSPVHGEFRHLKEHCRLAHEQGLERDEIFLLEDGVILQIDEERTEVIGKLPHGRVLVDGKGIGDVDEVILRDRRYLSQDGTLVAIVGVDHETGELLSGPEIVVRGFSLGEEEDAIKRLSNVVVEAWEELDAEARTEKTEVQASIKRALRRYIKNEARRFPVILAIVMEL